MTLLLVALLALGLVAWRLLAPRAIRPLRRIAIAASLAGLVTTLACASGHFSVAAYQLAIDAYALVALALYAEIARAVVDRLRGARRPPEELPRVRSLRRG